MLLAGMGSSPLVGEKGARSTVIAIGSANCGGGEEGEHSEGTPTHVLRRDTLGSVPRSVWFNTRITATHSIPPMISEPAVT